MNSCMNMYFNMATNSLKGSIFFFFRWSKILLYQIKFYKTFFIATVKNILAHSSEKHVHTCKPRSFFLSFNKEYNMSDTSLTLKDISKLKITKKTT